MDGDLVLAKLIEICIFLFVLLKTVILLPFTLLGTLLSYIVSYVASLLCNFGIGSATVSLPKFGVPQSLQDYASFLKYSTTDEDRKLNWKVIITFIVLVIGIIVSLVLVFSKEKLSSPTEGTTSPQLSKSIGYSILLLLFFAALLIALPNLTKDQISQEDASVAQGLLDPNFTFGAPSDGFLGKIKSWFGIISIIAYTIFIVFLFGTVLKGANINETKFQNASYIMAAVAGLLVFFLFQSTFQSPKLGVILGLGFLALCGYLIYYAYENPTKGLFSFDNFVTGLSILSTLMVFYLVFRSGHEGEFNITKERIKMLVLFFSFIAIMIIFKTSAPGTIVKDYFGNLFAVSISIAVFCLVYLIVLMITPEENQSSSYGPKNLLDILNTKTWGLFIALLIFMAIAMSGLATNFDFLKEKDNLGISIIVILFTSIIFGALIAWPKTPEFGGKFIDVSKTMSIYKILLYIFGACGVALFGYWVFKEIKGFESSSSYSISQSIVNLLLILVVATFIYKILIIEFPSLLTGYWSVFTDVLFYIPCFLAKVTDWLTKTYFGSEKGTIPLLIILSIILFAIKNAPNYSLKVKVGGGNVLLENPVSLRTKTVAATYEQLNPGYNFNYRYAISLWTFLDAMPPNTNENYDKYTSIMSFGGKPDILYNASTNTALVTMKLTDVDPNKYEILDLGSTVYGENYLQEGESIVIVERIHDFLLQKWNNFVINCDGGTIDVFLNNDLKASKIEMVPYMTYDNLTVGQSNGLYGGVKKLVYHSDPMTTAQMDLAYTTSKNEFDLP